MIKPALIDLIFIFVEDKITENYVASKVLLFRRQTFFFRISKGTGSHPCLRSAAKPAFKKLNVLNFFELYMQRKAITAVKNFTGHVFLWSNHLYSFINFHRIRFNG